MTRPPRILVAAANAFGWAADRALTRLAPSAPRHVIEAENHRLRKAHRELYMENVAFSAIVSDLAEQLARATGHPCVAGTSRDDSGQILRKATTRFVATGGEDFAEWDREFVYDQEADQ